MCQLSPVSPTHVQPVWKRAAVDHFPMWSGACQSEPYYTMSQLGVGCKAYWMGTSEVRFPQKRMTARKAKPPWHGTQWSGTARYGMVRFQTSVNAGLAPSFEWWSQ